MYAATPVTCGQDIEVQERTEYFTRLVSYTLEDGETSGENAARISTPGADISGCKSSTIVSDQEKKIKESNKQYKSRLCRHRP